jgi:hypothetical protein
MEEFIKKDPQWSEIIRKNMKNNTGSTELHKKIVDEKENCNEKEGLKKDEGKVLEEEEVKKSNESIILKSSNDIVMKKEIEKKSNKKHYKDHHHHHHHHRNEHHKKENNNKDIGGKKDYKGENNVDIDGMDKTLSDDFNDNDGIEDLDILSYDNGKCVFWVDMYLQPFKNVLKKYGI